MKRLIFGATGTIAQRILREAVARGHQVTAASRHVSQTMQESGVRAVRADILIRRKSPQQFNRTMLSLAPTGLDRRILLCS